MLHGVGVRVPSAAQKEFVHNEQALFLFGGMSVYLCPCRN